MLLVLLLVVGLSGSGSGSDLCSGKVDGSCEEGNFYKEPISSGAVVSYDELKQMLGSGDVQLFDVREPDEFEDGSISSATNIPLGEVERAFTLTPDQFRELYRVSMPTKSHLNFILYCQRGRRSLSALQKIHRLGYSRARHYAGGYGEWVEMESQ
ncbi:thiosulfate sulfurtransferase/rhodanese-like domain-containing protein 1 [Astyanax mexicanus]|uniref:thiosulfate sulfurtransferase/rhodanese-like domain-containing protein 1 n=1 Tax=Astyanax mexicanus TaxID=7994 RepID=UPI0020CB1F89|nr:thiosulfate sulfurtransferase/rhodanese-like domain-containing protein 1 [Astyanax mexicanus]